MNLRVLVYLALAAALAACSSPVKLDQSAADIENKGAQAGANQAASTGATTSATESARAVANVEATAPADPLDEPDGLLAKRTIFFDYDSFTIREEFRPLVEAHGKYLTANPERRIVLQGNTDERGAREYNLALGQKRSEAVRRALAVLGVTENQVEAVSFGEERPKNTGVSEAAYAENRRVDIVYQ